MEWENEEVAGGLSKLKWSLPNLKGIFAEIQQSLYIAKICLAKYTCTYTRYLWKLPSTPRLSSFYFLVR